jgi:hypothetical protein
MSFKEDKSFISMTFDAMKAILINANVEATSTSAEKAPMEFAGSEFSGCGSGGTLRINGVNLKFF